MAPWVFLETTSRGGDSKTHLNTVARLSRTPLKDPPAPRAVIRRDRQSERRHASAHGPGLKAVALPRWDSIDQETCSDRRSLEAPSRVDAEPDSAMACTASLEAPLRIEIRRFESNRWRPSPRCSVLTPHCFCRSIHPRRRRARLRWLDLRVSPSQHGVRVPRGGAAVGCVEGGEGPARLASDYREDPAGVDKRLRHS